MKNDSIPKELMSCLENMLSKIDARGELPHEARANLYAQIKKLSDREHENAFYYRMCKLEIVCAYKVIGYLENGEQLKERAESMLDDARKCLLESGDLKVLEREKHGYETKIEDLMDRGSEFFRAAYAGYACISALNTVLYDVNLNSIAGPEKDISPEDWSASFNASLAFSGSATWENHIGSDSLRKEFWVWLLKLAIPAIWDPQVPPGPITCN